jgi:hypothetical protein
MKIRLQRYSSRHWMEVSGLLHDPTSLPLERELLVCIKQKLSNPRASVNTSEDRKSLLLLGFKPKFPSCPPCSLVTILTELSWLFPYIILFCISAIQTPRKPPPEGGSSFPGTLVTMYQTIQCHNSKDKNLKLILSAHTRTCPSSNIHDHFVLEVFCAWEDGIFICLNPDSVFQHQLVHLHRSPSIRHFTTEYKLPFHIPFTEQWAELDTPLYILSLPESNFTWLLMNSWCYKVYVHGINPVHYVWGEGGHLFELPWHLLISINQNTKILGWTVNSWEEPG